jgi:hypothetical protein
MNTKYGTTIKSDSRAWGIEQWRLLNRMQSIPEDRQLLSLCNYQFRDSSSELPQYIDSGIIHEAQYVGIDRSEDIIQSNRELFPAVQWRTGELLDVVTHEPFSPALFHVDTLNEPQAAAQLTLELMNLYPQNITMLVNVIQYNAWTRREYTSEAFPNYLAANAFEYQIDNFHLRQPIPSYMYISQRSAMRTYVIHS